MYTGKTNAIVNIKCPYFLYEKEKSITCEGVCEQCRNKMSFESPDDKDAYIIRHCLRYPNNCLLAAGLDERYGE